MKHEEPKLKSKKRKEMHCDQGMDVCTDEYITILVLSRIDQPMEVIIFH